MLDFNESVYKKISNAGAGNIVVGILMIIVGLTLGILTIVQGARILSSKKHLID